MTIARDIQPGLFEGGRDKAVGPLPLSIVHGSNSDLIASIAPLYLTGGGVGRDLRPRHVVAPVHP